MQHRSY